MKENYYALLISIFTRCTPEEAFEAYYEAKKITKHLPFTKEEIIDMARYKAKGLTLQQIADIFSASRFVVCKKLKKLAREAKTA
jgi:hypothetical protein